MAAATNRSARGRTSLLTAGMLVFAVACVELPGGHDEDAIAIGALLPFTGDIGASGTNIERAVRMVLEGANQAGGIAGKPLRLIARDTHSDPRRGIKVANDLFDRERILGLLGPENDDLAMQTVPLVRDHQLVQISGGVVSPAFRTIHDDGYFFRTAPSALVYAKALARRMQQDGIRKAAILNVGNAYGYGFAAVMVNELIARGIEIRAPISFQPGEPSYVSVIQVLLADPPDAVMLIAYPKTAAAIIQEWAIMGGGNAWYLAPSLKTEVFVANVPPGSLNGALGVAPAVAADAPAFSLAFSKRWYGDLPLNSAYFYYDATVIMVLAMAAAAREAGGVPGGEQIRDQIIAVSSPDGEPLAWNQLDQALEMLRQGKLLNYNGVSGPVDLDDRGDLVDAAVEFWTVSKDKIVPLDDERRNLRGTRPIRSRLETSR